MPGPSGGMGEPGIRSAFSLLLSNDGLQRYVHYVFTELVRQGYEGSSGMPVIGVPGLAAIRVSAARRPGECVTYCRVVNTVRVGVTTHCRAQQTTRLTVLRRHRRPT